ncbi:acyl carrier protein [Pseudoalteromonas umbrosa]|uniref:acyl carrier protein n=1 Tax=Pseudoalteromonas umbrosa TaxID=3048489 RepID=UPI0024C2DE31|nr:acyl carrier protein [Pseudoalteromonas sp. B95]MDK1288217.1 acyl carrier protein [Pseudoalteromonas sp. B95]
MKQPVMDPSNLADLMEGISKGSSEQTNENCADVIENLDPIPKKINEIWCDILGCASFGQDEDLFDAGGDSVSAVQVFSEINKEFGIQIDIEELFSSECLSINWFSDLVKQYLADLSECNMVQGTDEKSSTLES